MNIFQVEIIDIYLQITHQNSNEQFIDLLMLILSKLRKIIVVIYNNIRKNK